MFVKKSFSEKGKKENVHQYNISSLEQIKSDKKINNEARTSTQFVQNFKYQQVWFQSTNLAEK